jgi:thiamine-phosphate pyrophosphorylase
MLITDRHRLHGRPLEEVASQAVEGGVNVVQLREKDLTGGELYDLAITVHAVLRGRALLLVNDRVDVAVAAGVDGVHLPEAGIASAKVRQMTGEACLIGRSVHSIEAATRAVAEGADYLIFGNVHETASKRGAPAAGIGFVRAVAEAVDVPVIAVGGMTAHNLGAAIAAGADGIAVIGAVLDEDDPKAAAARLRTALDSAYGPVATR